MNELRDNNDSDDADNYCCRRSMSRSDNNLRFQDETEAYTSYKAVGHFTPSPGV